MLKSPAVVFARTPVASSSRGCSSLKDPPPKAWSKGRRTKTSTASGGTQGTRRSLCIARCCRRGATAFSWLCRYCRNGLTLHRGTSSESPLPQAAQRTILGSRGALLRLHEWYASCCQRVESLAFVARTASLPRISQNRRTHPAPLDTPRALATTSAVQRQGHGPKPATTLPQLRPTHEHARGLVLPRASTSSRKFQPSCSETRCKRARPPNP
mmetsp:Transcript_21097/g.58961  ORF Transcript_21097/g.58961 Transcript_21097/m.58961 type:complete len:213 (+) Transcript_21097:749-1387(+)